jgi:hypothetical protein
MHSIGYIYSRHRLKRWTQAVIENFQQKLLVFSEYDLGFTEQWNFYTEYKRQLGNKRGYSAFSASEIYDITRRCRVLRGMSTLKSYEMIMAAEKSTELFVSQRNPAFLIAPRVENFILDVTERILAKYGIPYIGVWRSAFVPNNFFVTNRGVPLKLVAPPQARIIEFVESVSSIDFRATSLRGSNFSTLHFIKSFARFFLRDVALEASRHLTGNQKNFRELATRFHCQDYKADLIIKKSKFLNEADVCSKLASSSRKKLFLALQVNPEATIDYYSPNIEFLDVEKVVTELIASCRKNHIDLVIKDHPNMFGRRKFNWLYSLLGDDVVLADYGVDSNVIINQVDYVFTWSGTVSVQAYIQGKIPVVVCPPFLSSLPGFVKLEKVSDLDELSDVLLSQPMISAQDKLDLALSVLETHLPGQVFVHDALPFGVETFCRSLEWCLDHELLGRGAPIA